MIKSREISVSVISLRVTLLFLLLSGFAHGRAAIELAFGHTSYDFAPLFAQFERETGHQILTAPSEGYDLKVELVKRRQKKRLPDVFIAPADYATIPGLTLFYPEADWFDPDLSEKALETTRGSGNQVAIPLILGNHLVLYYNKSMVPKPAQSFDELLQQKSTIPGHARLITWTYSGTYFFIPFLSSFDALPFKQNQLTLNSPGMSKALEYYWSLPEKGLAHPNCDVHCYPDYFINNKFAYIIDGVWSLQKYQQGLGENLGIATLPAINGQPMKPYFNSHIFAVIESDRSPEEMQAIKQLALFLQSEYSQNWLWENSKALPANAKILSQILRSGDANMRAIVEQLEYAHATPQTPYMSIIWEALAKGFNRYGANILSSEESAILMQHLAKRTMERQQWQ